MQQSYVIKSTNKIYNNIKMQDQQSQHSTLMDNIFPLDFKSMHSNSMDIYTVKFLSNSSNILVIDTERHYFVYNILSEQKLKVKFSGCLNPMADNFNEIFFQGKSYLLYLADDTIYLHSLQSNEVIDSWVFKENKFLHQSIYQEQYKLQLIEVQNEYRKNSSVILFWKVSSLYKSSNRQITYEVKILEITQKQSKGKYQNHLSTLQTQALDFIYAKTPQISAHRSYKKSIKIESQKYLSFSYAFQHLLSYQLEGYHIQFRFMQKNGQTLKILSINSIYNQLIKSIIPSKNYLLILTKHQSMNMEQVLRDQENHHGIGHNQIINQQTFEMQHEFDSNQEKYNQNEKFKRMYDHLFLQSGNYSKQHSENDQRVDIYAIYAEKNESQEHSNCTNDQNQEQENCGESVDLAQLKVIKLQHSVLRAKLPKNIVSKLNIVSTFQQFNICKSFKSHQSIKGLGKNPAKDYPKSNRQIYYENIFTQKPKHLANGQQQLSLEMQNSLLKISYTKGVLYSKILDQVLSSEKITLKKEELTQTSEMPLNFESDCGTQLIFNQQTQVQNESHQRMLTPQSSQLDLVKDKFVEEFKVESMRQFKELVLNMLIQ